MLKNLIKILIGIFAIPIALGVCMAFILEVNNIGTFYSPLQKIFLLGIVLYVIMHLFLFKPNYIYVFGHEFVHALAIWLCLGSVKKIKVSKDGGSVTGTKNNLFISTSPYFVPIFPIIIAVIYFVISASYEISDLGVVFVGILGFTVAMHLIMTVDTLKVQQPDLIAIGQILATVAVVSVNILIIGFIMSVLFEDFSFKNFTSDSFYRTKDIYALIVKQLFLLG